VKQLSLLGNLHTTKRCTRCGEVKPESEFSKIYKNKEKRRSQCKDCQKEWQANNSEKINKRIKKYREENIEILRVRENKWRENNRDKIREKSRNDYLKNRKIPMYRINSNISRMITRDLRNNKNGNHWENLVDFTLQTLKPHLEKLFKPGMNWENYGKWHLDHIKPIASFNFNSYKDKEFKECWTLENLQPLWASENLSKGDTH